jgi:hypothetical protein
VLFNNAFMLAKDDGRKITPKQVVDLSDGSVFVRDTSPLRTSAEGAELTPPFSFELVTPARSFLLIAASVSEKQGWMKDLGHVLSECLPAGMKKLKGWRHQVWKGTLFHAAVVGDDLTATGVSNGLLVFAAPVLGPMCGPARMWLCISPCVFESLMSHILPRFSPQLSPCSPWKVVKL